MRVFSFGGGRQSMSVLVLAAQGRLQYDAFLFSNVGEKAENPETLRYFREVALPYAQAHGIELVEVARRYHKTGEQRDLYDHLVGDIRTIAIPAYMDGGQGNRKCTNEWKRAVIARWLKQHGATPAAPATVGIGFSLDEYQRMNTDSGIPWVVNEWPLIDLRMTLEDCRRVIRDAGLPEPPKSSCWFCPYKRHGEWLKMRQEQPGLFDRAVALEKRINEKRTMIGKDTMYLHRSLRPLDQIGEQMTFDFEENCESGYCMI